MSFRTILTISRTLIGRWGKLITPMMRVRKIRLKVLSIKSSGKMRAIGIRIWTSLINNWSLKKSWINRRGKQRRKRILFESSMIPLSSIFRKRRPASKKSSWEKTVTCWRKFIRPYLRRGRLERGRRTIIALGKWGRDLISLCFSGLISITKAKTVI